MGEYPLFRRGTPYPAVESKETYLENLCQGGLGIEREVGGRERRPWMPEEETSPHPSQISPLRMAGRA